jgi:hypothetical protein
MKLNENHFPKQEEKSASHPKIVNSQITDAVTRDSVTNNKPNASLKQDDTDYIELDFYPHYPEGKTPSREDCAGYKYMAMNQLCNIAEKNGFGRSKACKAFGGDKGKKYPVTSERKVRHKLLQKGKPEKFVLIDAVEQYFAEIGIDWA